MDKLKIGWCVFILPLLIAGCVQKDEGDFALSLSLLQRKIQKTEKLVEKSSGYNRQAGTIDCNIAGFFADYIDWELKHPEIMKDVLARDRFYGSKKLSPEQKTKRFNEYIGRELSDASLLMDHAMERLNKMPDWNVPDMADWKKMEYKDGNFHIGDRVVFPGGFTILAWDLVDRKRYPEWTGTDERKAKESFIPKMREMGLGMMDLSIHIQTLLTGEGEIDMHKMEEISTLLDWYESLGVKVDIMLQFGKSEVLEKLWPGITAHSGNGVAVDIDHPGVRELLDKVLEKLMPELQKHTSIISFEMANEPFFYMEGWSKYTLEAYRVWLQLRHHSIDKLNALWHTDYGDFNDIPLPANKTKEKCSEGEWYDRVIFHNCRVSSFFASVAEKIHRYMPEAVVHMKAQDNNSLGPKSFSVTDGIDREMLGRYVDLHGVDTRPLPCTEPRMAVTDAEEKVLNYNASLYSFHWLGQSFLYDYLESLEPHHPIIDMEYHAFSINPIRIPDIGTGHARAALWLAHMHGLIGNMVWYWNARYGPDPFPADYYKGWFYGSISTQPLVAAEYFQTMLQLNIFSEEVVCLANPVEKPVRLLVSVPSYIHDQRHINALHRIYEAACFHGLPVGFLTENEMTEAGRVPDDTKYIVMPDVRYISKEALSVLRQAKKEGVHIVRFGHRATDKDEYGFPYPEKELAFMKDLPQLDYAGARELDEKFAYEIRECLDSLPIKVRNIHGGNAFGVMRRHAVCNGKPIVLMVNLNPRPVHLKMCGRDGKCLEGFDKLNQEKMEAGNIYLPVKGVRLVEVMLPDKTFLP